MSDDLQRLRRDLVVMQEAVGGPLPFVWTDVGYNLLLAGGGAVTAALAASLPARWLAWTLVPMLTAAAPAMWAGRRRAEDDAGQAMRRREARLGWWVGVLVAAAAVPFLLLQRRQAMPVRTTLGGACIVFTGVVCAAQGLSGRARRYWWGTAVPLVIWGFLLPGQSVREIAVGGGIMAVVAGLLTAGIQARQLRDVERA